MRQKINGFGARAAFWARRLIGDETGVAAIEMAMVAPVFAAALVLTVDVASQAIDRVEMHSAVVAGARYFMSGGTDLTEARNVLLSAWPSRPDDASVLTESYCECAGAAAACSETCPGGSIPETFYRIRATASLGGIIGGSDYLTVDELRVR